MNKESRILLDCTLSPEMYGIISIDIPIRRYIIYAQPVVELVGFRTKHSVVTIGSTTYIEVGTFFDLLFECDYTSWRILTHQGHDINEIEEFTESYKDLVCLKLIKVLFNDQKKNIKKINEKLVDYCKISYLCGEQLFLTESLLLSKEMKIDKKNILQAILECKLHDKTIKKLYMDVYKNIEKHIATSDFNLDFDRDKFNLNLLKIRNI